MKREIFTHFEISEIDQIISGGAKGADMLAEQFGREYNISTMIFRAAWNKHGRQAGYMRNTLIAQYADCAIAFPIGLSLGTYDTIRKMEQLGFQIFICHNLAGSATDRFGI